MGLAMTVWAQCDGVGGDVLAPVGQGFDVVDFKIG